MFKQDQTSNAVSSFMKQDIQSSLLKIFGPQESWRNEGAQCTSASNGITRYKLLTSDYLGPLTAALFP
jgi:hypothetical protein